MAETAVNIAIEQLATLLIVEANKLRGARAGVASIQQDLELITAFLKDADQQQKKEAVKVWVKQLREIAYSIEDTLDTFSYRMGRPSGRGLAGFYRTSTRFIRRLYALRWVSGQVDDLRSQLRDMSERKNDFGLTAASDRVPAADNMDPVPRLASMFVEESQIVGIDKPKGEIIDRLLDSKKLKYAVVSLAGMGGLGKTTLARKVYEDPILKQNFTCLAWITVSKTFDEQDLLKNMYKQLHNVTSTTTEPSAGQLQRTTSIAASSDNVSSMNYIQVVEALRAFLRDRCYMVVLDDIWTVDAWEVIKCALPENNKGSRIMVTTRFTDVATACSQNDMHVHHLKPLSKPEAKDLLCKKVFGADHGNACPPELDDKATKILDLCGGLPLAIVAIGGLLSTKRRSPNEWESVFQSIGYELETNDRLKTMTKILWLSYDDLPHQLKPCFLYFGVFPEDYSVKRSKVTRLWIAEGFVKPLPNKSLEKISEDYLQELVQRSLVQASTFDYLGRVQRCRVHDLMYELILSKSKEQNFHLSSPTTSGPSTTTAAELPDNVRRFVANAGPSLAALSSFSRLRSLLCLGATSVPPLSTHRSLKVLHLKGVKLDSFPVAILDLFHLRYLHMRKANISSLPEDISRLRNLQTLDMKWNPISSLPQGILKLTNIRHILIYETIYFGVELPDKFGSLTSLQKLAQVNITGGAAQIEELSNLIQLRRLAIMKISPDDGAALCRAIKNMSNLQSLYLYPGEDDQLLPVDQLYVNSPSLRSINLRGGLKALPEFILSLDCLEKLRLNCCKLQIDIFMSLQHLPCLMELYFHNEAYQGEWLRTERGGFKKLRKIYIQNTPKLRRVVIAEGAMPNLDYLEFFKCANLESVPTGIEHLKNLKELFLGFVPVECLQKIRKDEGEDWDRVKHIPLVKEVYDVDGRLYRRDP